MMRPSAAPKRLPAFLVRSGIPAASIALGVVLALLTLVGSAAAHSPPRCETFPPTSLANAPVTPSAHPAPSHHRLDDRAPRAFDDVEATELEPEDDDDVDARRDVAAPPGRYPSPSGTPSEGIEPPAQLDRPVDTTTTCGRPRGPPAAGR